MFHKSFIQNTVYSFHFLFFSLFGYNKALCVWRGFSRTIPIIVCRLLWHTNSSDFDGRLLGDSRLMTRKWKMPLCIFETFCEMSFYLWQTECQWHWRKQVKHINHVIRQHRNTLMQWKYVVPILFQTRNKASCPCPLYEKLSNSCPMNTLKLF